MMTKVTEITQTQIEQVILWGLMVEWLTTVLITQILLNCRIRLNKLQESRSVASSPVTVDLQIWGTKIELLHF